MTQKILDIFQFARSTRELSGELALFDFQELPGVLISDEKKADVLYRLSPTAGTRGLPAVRLELRASLITQCVHCGRPCEVSIDKQLDFLLTASEAEADRIPLEEDGDFDVTVGSDRFDLVHLIEEELILSLPPFPRHEHCEVQAHRLETAETEKTQETNRPFANLESLLSKK